ncbi:MAG TPA: DUF6252 family protein [Mucilaginibacter sp.]|nr:DUF6252 family protein [Mucilaginibacter sp.]
MNKLKLIVLLLLSAIIIQSCNKDAVTASASTTAAFQANINGSTWAPDTLGTTITYDPDTKIKVFNCFGVKDQKRVSMSIKLTNQDSADGFALGTYTVTGDGSIAMQYSILQKNSEGQYVYVPHGTVAAGSGSIIITAVDSVKKTITGTFSFYSRSTVYDNDGNVVSITVDNITAGEFTSLAYTNAPQQ